MQVSGPEPVVRGGITSLVEAVLDSLTAAGTLAPATLLEFGEVMRRFASFCEVGHGLVSPGDVLPRHAEAFVRALRQEGEEPSPATMHVRRGALRMLYKEGRRLGHVRGDPTLDLRLPPRGSMGPRGLTDDEVELCRAYALDSLTALRRPLAWALSETTARTSEIPRTRIRDVDLAGMRVYLHGAPRVEPRWAPLTEWAAAQIDRRLKAARLGRKPDDPLVIWRGRHPREPRAAASMAVIETLRAAGLHGEDPEVRPRSIVVWAGRRLFNAGAPIDEVARALGFRRLDAAAEFIGHDWRRVGEDGPP